VRTNTLLSFEAEQARRGAYARIDRGFQTVRVASVVGSVGRADSLDRRFRHRHRLWSGEPRGTVSRRQRLCRLFDEGRVPPLELYQIGDDLFVLDGHHRLAIALDRGQEYVEAHVVEFLPDARDPSNLVVRERAAFVRATGLDEVHATEPGRYPKLLNRIRDYRHERLRATGSGPPTDVQLVLGLGPRARPAGDIAAAARDWYHHEYRPVVEALVVARIPAVFPGRAMGDLYGYVCDHRWYMGERAGEVGLDAALADFVGRHPPPLADTFLDPIATLGAEVLERSPALGPLRGWSANTRAALVAGLLALPLAFARGLRPAHYRFPRLNV
jgi:hypothetical protein